MGNPFNNDDLVGELRRYALNTDTAISQAQQALKQAKRYQDGLYRFIRAAISQRNGKDWPQSAVTIIHDLYRDLPETEQQHVKELLK